MKRGEILDAVKKTICQDRNDIHGEPENSFPMIAKRWTEYLQAVGLLKDGARLNDYHAAELLAEFKQVRHQIQPAHADNQHDQIGYLAIAAELRANWNAQSGVNAASEVINGGPPPAPPGFPPRPPKHKNDTTVHENKIFEARKRHGTNELFWIYGGEAPGTPNRKPNFEGEVWVCVSGNFKGFEWTARPNQDRELLWHRTK